MKAKRLLSAFVAFAMVLTTLVSLSTVTFAEQTINPKMTVEFVPNESAVVDEGVYAYNLVVKVSNYGELTANDSDYTGRKIATWSLEMIFDDPAVFSSIGTQRQATSDITKPGIGVLDNDRLAIVFQVDQDGAWPLDSEKSGTSEELTLVSVPFYTTTDYFTLGIETIFEIDNYNAAGVVVEGNDEIYTNDSAYNERNGYNYLETPMTITVGTVPEPVVLTNAMYDFEDMDSIVQTEYSDWYEVTKMTAATDENGEAILDESDNAVYNYTYGDIQFSNGGTRGIAQSRYVVPKATATETSFVSPTADQMPYRNLQGDSGFKNVTVYQTAATLTTSVKSNQLFHNTMGPTKSFAKSGSVGWYTWDALRNFNNLNLIVNPVKENKIDFGFNFYVRKYIEKTSTLIDSATKAGGFGEIADSSINGEYYGGKYNSNDKIVKARLDKAYGYAVYDETIDEETGEATGWTTIATADDLGTDAWHSIRYRVDPAKKTYTVYLDDADKGTFPFSNEASITAVDAIEFNCMNNSSAYGTSNYAIDDVYAIEAPVTVKFVDESGKLIEEKNVQAGDKIELPVIADCEVTASASDLAALEAVPNDMTVVLKITVIPVKAMYDFEDMDSIAQTEYSDWYEVTKMTAATDEDGEAILDGSGNAVYNYTYGDIQFSNGGTRGIAQSRYVVPKATATETSFVSPDADQMPYRNLQGNTGFKNVTVYHTASTLTTDVKSSQLFYNTMGPTNAYKNLEGESNISWYTWENATRKFNNLNLIVNPVKEHKIDFGFNFYVRKYKDVSSDSNVDSATKAGGFGEIADSSINGEYYGSKYNSNDKIVKARLDSNYGYAVYDETIDEGTGVAKGWTTIAAADVLGTDAWHSIKYCIDPAKKTYTVYLDGADKGTFPFSNAASITAVDAIEFNCMGGTVCGTSNYAVDDVYATNAAYTGDEEPETKTYTVTFKNGDTVLAEVKVKEGGTAVYTGETPTKDADDNYTYEFKGWDVELTNVTGDLVATAQFNAIAKIIKHTVTFKNWDDSILDTQEVEDGKGAVAPANPTRAEDDEYTYEFEKWDTDFTSVTADLIIKAIFKATAKTTEGEEITFVCGDVNGDGVANGVDASYIMGSTTGGGTSYGKYKIGEEIVDGIICGDVNGDGVANGVDASYIMGSTTGGGTSYGKYKIGETVTIKK